MNTIIVVMETLYCQTIVQLWNVVVCYLYDECF